MTRVENDTAAQRSGPPDARRDHSGPPRGLTESYLDPPDRTIYQPNVVTKVTGLLTHRFALRLTGVRTSPALVTVITPAYNVGPWIGEAIDSVRCQTERRFEYIVVDDGSTDDTADVVRARAAEDDRIRLVSISNSGSGAARNVGLAQASAPFVAFLDGDDRWGRDFLRCQLTAMQEAPPEVGVAFCHTRVMMENGNVVALRWQPSGPCDVDRLLVENNPPHHGSSLLIRRSCFEELGDFDPAMRSAVDFEMWLRIASRSSTPLFWGVRRYQVDMRLMRSGCISANRGARFAALDGLLDEYAPTMTRLNPGLAYVRPAVFAYRDGYEDYAEKWAAQALTAGAADLARAGWGPSMLAWHRAGAARRAQMRSARDRTRTAVYGGAAYASRAFARLGDLW
jgi:glycosyltransferase involved in cell wall biosynthesis